MQFHQILVSASPGDAITNMALELDDLLSAVAPSSVHAPYRDAAVWDRVEGLETIARMRSPKPSDDVIIFHASIGEPTVTQFVARRPERLIVIYHNISPWERFVAFDPVFAGLLASGRVELASLADKADLALTVSEYNARELFHLGFRDIAVVPLAVDVAALLALEPHEPTLHHFEQALEGPTLLFVGQVLPHKRPDLLIKAYHLLTTYIMPEVNLAIVGSPRLPRYATHLSHLLQELNLHKAGLFGRVSPTELAALYRSADAFVTMSEHEGFCVPLVEAMGFSVPVIARDQAAISETLAGAGLLLPGEEDAMLAAESMAEILTDQRLRNSLVESGHDRVRELDPDLSRARLLDHILSVA